METRRLGKTGLRVPVLCLGTMTFGLQCDRDTSFAILDAALAGGLDFLDCADVYPLGGGLETVGRTEEILGEWMRERGNRARIVLATKCAGPMGRGPNDHGLSRQHIVTAVEASLRRLRTDWIDLYQSHAFDPATPIDETLRAFDDLVRAGKVRYVGCSNYPAWRLAGALRAADRLGVAGYVSVQPRYNLLYREIETRAAAALPGRGARRAGLQPARGRLPLGKAQGRREARGGHALHARHGSRDLSASLLAGGAVPRGRAACQGGRGARDRAGFARGGVGARAAGHHVGDHRREPAPAARGVAGRDGAEARRRAAEALRRALVGATAPAGGRGLSLR